MRVPIGGPFVTTQEMQANVAKVLTSGRLSPGPFVDQFEREFAATHSVRQAIMVNSGTSALVVALQALKEVEGWADGSEIIVPSVTFVATINAVLHCRLKPVLVDIDPTDYTIDIDQIQKKSSANTVGIMPVHAFGLPANMPGIMEMADAFHLRVIEDACEALGASCNGKLAGSIGDIGCFSFYMSHHITTGVGGMAITDNPVYGRKIRSLVNHGWEREIAPMDETKFDFEAIRQRYHFKSIGHSFRPTEFEAAIALPQLATLKENLKARVDNAKRLTNILKPYADKIQLPKVPYNRSHALMMYPVVLREGDKWGLIRHLEEAGIETREMLPLTNQPCYEGLFNENDYPIAKWINAQGFYLPCSHYLAGEQMDFIGKKIGEYFD
ncbi:MAG: DegT/DnrJ/EryC1/StrS aminotransferase family protein [Planctomycetaceae bacterium]|nr:DegT/DnrJ/EryC1/StrS aminotransferase family protein [Planctomycetaceae bacterium]